MEQRLEVGRTDLREFGRWWEEWLPSWLLLRCERGEAVLSLQFRPYRLTAGMMTIVAPDMFPSVGWASDDFCARYCVGERDFADEVLYDVPKEFFDAIYVAPLLAVGEALDPWFDMLDRVAGEAGDNPWRAAILGDVVHGLLLSYYHLWQQRNGDQTSRPTMTRAEQLCSRFYDMVFDQFREQRDVGYYADALCITPCYLAMILRQVCGETPKQAIARQVVLTIKHMLRTTVMTVEQIAGELNFADTSYMCRYFRRYTGVSMGEYRRGAGNEVN